MRRYALIVALAWTAAIAGSFAWYYRLNEQQLLAVSKSKAVVAFERDVLYRQWVSKQGGVYVPVSPSLPPNPLLGHVPERDITTPSGKPLTLVNATYLLRKVFETNGKNEAGGYGHLVSLNPLNPENRPDPWEEKALRSFERGAREVSEIQTINGRVYMRLMRVFVTEKSCLNCHSRQGYHVGDIRGGMGVTVPISDIMEANRPRVIGGMAGHGLIWILGLGTLWFGSRKLCNNVTALQQSEKSLQKQTEQLERLSAELVAKNWQLEAMTLQDALTDLANRRCFDETLDTEWARAARTGQPLALLLLDVDHFKEYNDRYGHQAGDECLRSVAQVLRAGARRVSDLAARYGGEEFVVIAADTDTASALYLAESMRKQIEGLAISHEQTDLGHVSISIGVAVVIPDERLEAAELVRMADDALYRAKNGGRNRVELVAPSVQASPRKGDGTAEDQPLIQLAWKQSYACGEPAIDEDHRKLFRLVNTLFTRAIIRDADPERFNEAFDGLLSHAADHFTQEEEILRRHAYEDVDEHAEQHRLLVEHALKLRLQADKSGVSAGELIDFLVNEVVVGHLLRTDLAFYPLFAPSGQGTA
ncbi:diguanylate cyclase [Geobacter sp. AOG2]|uniref:diguanylate cyclase n=1 Tax=Geobacter sp. AOG2 TaxID=1566347 RepID=UPI001CC3D46B|nr:diguanylate cyclase [Geobacter sp. AOG2]